MFTQNILSYKILGNEKEEEEIQIIRDYLGCILKLYCLREYQVMRRRRRRRRRRRSRE